MVMIADLERQISTRQCRHRDIDVRQGAGHGLHHIVDAFAQRQEEAFLVGGADALIEIALLDGIDDRLNLFAGIDLGGHVLPLDDGAQAFILFIDDRVGDERHGVPAGIKSCFVTRSERFDQVLLVRRILVKTVDTAANDLLRLEAGNELGQVGFQIGKKFQSRLIEITNVIILIGHHHTGRYIIQRLFDARILVRYFAFAFKVGVQFLLHFRQRLQHQAGFIGAALRNVILQITFCDGVSDSDGFIQL